MDYLTVPYSLPRHSGQAVSLQNYGKTYSDWHICLPKSIFDGKRSVAERVVLVLVQQLIVAQIEFFLSEGGSRHDQCVRLQAETMDYASADQSRIASEVNAVYDAIEENNFDSTVQTLSEHGANTDASGEDESRKDQDEASNFSSSAGKYRGSHLAFLDCIVAVISLLSNPPCMHHILC